MSLTICHDPVQNECVTQLTIVSQTVYVFKTTDDKKIERHVLIFLDIYSSIYFCRGEYSKELR